MSDPTPATYSEIARASRLKVLDLIYKAQTSHIGSNFSCADILAVLFEKIDLDKDRFVLSAGWKAAMLYYHLWRKGRITLEELDSYCQPDSKWIGLAEPVHKDIPIAGGSMGIGFPGAVGLALAKKLKGEEGTVYCLMSDGELQCGTTWESALIASKHKLDNLIVIVDDNGFQAMGKTDEILGAGFPIKNWNGHKCDGHDYKALETLLSPPPPSENPMPTVILARTVKGRGVPKWENDNLWHYAQIKEDDYNYAKQCLNS